MPRANRWPGEHWRASAAQPVTDAKEITLAAQCIKKFGIFSIGAESDLLSAWLYA